MTAMPFSTISPSVERLKGYSFTLFHHIFWKRTIFEGVPVMDFLDFLVPRVHWGLKSMWKKFQKFLKKFGNFWRNFVSPLFYSLSNLLLVDRALLNLTIRSRSSTPEESRIMLDWLKDNLDPDLVKSLIPMNFKEFFVILEDMVPGMKELQKPVEDTWSLLQPVLLVSPRLLARCLDWKKHLRWM